MLVEGSLRSHVSISIEVSLHVLSRFGPFSVFTQLASIATEGSPLFGFVMCLPSIGFISGRSQNGFLAITFCAVIVNTRQIRQEECQGRFTKAQASLTSQIGILKQSYCHYMFEE